MSTARPILTRSPPSTRRPSPRVPLLVLASALTPLAAFHGAAVAQASDPNPYYIGGIVSITHDSNVFRSNQATGDSYWSAGLIGGIDQPIGRQRLYGSGIVRYNRYNDLTRLNNTSYGLNAGLDWATVNRLSGNLNVSANRSLANYGDVTLFNGQTTSRNIEKSSQELARVVYGAASRLSLEGSYTHRNLSYSDPAYASSGLKQDAVSGGVRYQSSAALSLGIALRYTKGKYDVADSHYHRRDVDLTTTWVPSGLSTVNARLSFGRQNSDDGNGNGPRDFSGATGYVSWLYTPTGRLRFNTWLSRDTGAETSFFNTTGLTVASDAARGNTSDITNTIAVDATYAVTGKISANAGVRYAHRSLERPALINGSVVTLEGSDNVYVASLGATYQALRNVSLSCNVAHEKRSTSSSLSVAYGATVVGCSAQATLQ